MVALALQSYQETSLPISPTSFPTHPSIFYSTNADANNAPLQMYETLADRKIHLLFELWDKDGDGHISFSELAMGLRKLCPASEPATSTAADAAEVCPSPSTSF